jgi:hypothetical protein
MKKEKNLNNSKIEEREILRDLNKAIDNDTHDINSKVSSLFENLELGEEDRPLPAWDASTETEDVLNNVLSEFGIENAEEISDRIMEELRNKGIIG